MLPDHLHPEPPRPSRASAAHLELLVWVARIQTCTRRGWASSGLVRKTLRRGGRPGSPRRSSTTGSPTASRAGRRDRARGRSKGPTTCMTSRGAPSSTPSRLGQVITCSTWAAAAGCCCATRSPPAPARAGSTTARTWWSSRASVRLARRSCWRGPCASHSPTTCSARWRCRSSSSSSLTPVKRSASAAVSYALTAAWPSTRRHLSCAERPLRRRRLRARAHFYSDDELRTLAENVGLREVAVHNDGGGQLMTGRA
jgi:hypothetical protein